MVNLIKETTLSKVEWTEGIRVANPKDLGERLPCCSLSFCSYKKQSLASANLFLPRVKHEFSISHKLIVGSFSIFFVILIWHISSLLPFLHAKCLVTLEVLLVDILFMVYQ